MDFYAEQDSARRNTRLLVLSFLLAVEVEILVSVAAALGKVTYIPDKLRRGTASLAANKLGGSECYNMSDQGRKGRSG
ncbi:MAG: hypothetical protein O7F73_06430 [Gammaproteobacteria bacterium]|nr:hypothetical protein [Gammaproteobacteria bacterium]